MSRLRSLGSLLLLLAVLIAGIVFIFQIRLGAGDIFPRYSSFRADPLGTRLLYDSLKEQPGLRVERSMERVDKLGTRPSRTLIMAGMSPVRWARLKPQAINALDAAVRGGSRLVVVYEAHNAGYTKPRRLPWDVKRSETEANDEPGSADKTQTPPAKRSDLEIGKSKPLDDKQAARDLLEREKLIPERMPEAEVNPAEKKKAQKKRTAGNDSDYKEDEDYPAPEGIAQDLPIGDWEGMDLFKTLWGVDLYGRMIMDRDMGALRGPGAPEGFPERLPWKSGSYLVFSKGSPWRVLYTRGTFPVMAELQHGAGSIVLATDAYCVSNEALLEKPPLSVLSWLVGASDTVIFDEAHLGVEQDKGLAMLARRYGLVPAMLLLVFAGGLYIWRQSARFIPPPQEEAELALEFHPTAGLEALLRRAVPGDKLYETCVSEWRRQARPTDLARIQSLNTGKGAAAYNAALAALRRIAPKK